MKYLIIYLMGVIATWGVLKWWRNLDKEYYNTWGDIIFCVVFSLFSLAGLVISVVFIIVSLGNNNKLPKPPKWL